MKYMNVEFLRFIFSVMIVYYHIVSGGFVKKSFSNSELYITLGQKASCGWIAVEFFLIIAGFFFYQSYTKKEQSWCDFALNKIARLWPVMAFTIFCWTAVHLCYSAKINLYTQFINLFFLQCIGVTLDFYGNLWFLSPFFWVLLLYFYILKNMKRGQANLIFALLLYFSLVGNINYFQGGFGRETIYTFINSGVMRVLAGIGTGYFIGVFYEKIKSYTIVCKTKVQKILKFVAVSAIEIYCFIFLINNTVFHRINFNNRLIFLIVFSILFIFFLLKQGLLSRLLDNKFFGFCGKYSYSIYAIQYVVLFILNHTLYKNQHFVFAHPYLNIFITIMFCFASGILTYKFIEVPAGKFLKEKVFFRTKE